MLCFGMQQHFTKSFLGWQSLKDLHQQENLSAKLFLGTPSPNDSSPENDTQEFAKVWGPSTRCFLPKGSWGQLSKSAILASKLLTPGPKPLLWSVLELGHLIEIAFIPKTLLACVVIDCQCFPSNTCLQCPNCVSIQNGHFYFSRLISALAWNSLQE